MRVIFTTIQYYPEALKMLELTLKSFFVFNKDFDFKVYCLDNSKDKFEEYFKDSKRSKYIDLERLEFINFKDGTKWNSTLTRWRNLEFKTEFERKNILKWSENQCKDFNFDIRMQISKFEILDDLISKYDLVIMSDIDIVYFNSIENIIDKFLKGENFACALKETENYFNNGFMLFNSKFKISNIFDKCLNFLNDDLTENKNFYLWSSGKFMACFEQDLLNNLISDKTSNIKEVFCVSQNRSLKKIFEANRKISVFHYASPYLKPGNKLKHESILFEKIFIDRAKNILKGQFKKYEVDVDKYI